VTRDEFLRRLTAEAQRDGFNATFEEVTVPTFRPIDDQVLVRIQPPEGTQGRLVVPDRAQERSLVGDVLAVGPGRPVPGGARLPVSVDPGDRVLVAKYAGDEVTLDGAVCLVVRAEDLLGVLEADPVEAPCP
jgi:chaperonin GroES